MAATYGGYAAWAAQQDARAVSDALGRKFVKLAVTDRRHLGTALGGANVTIFRTSNQDREWMEKNCIGRVLPPLLEEVKEVVSPPGRASTETSSVKPARDACLLYQRIRPSVTTITWTGESLVLVRWY